MLQQFKKLPNMSKALYVRLDDIFFSENKLVYFAEDFYNHGGKILFLDEVHKYHGWSQEIKNTYDNFPTLKIMFTASSALDIYKAVILNWRGFLFQYVVYETCVDSNTHQLSCKRFHFNKIIFFRNRLFFVLISRK